MRNPRGQKRLLSRAEVDVDVWEERDRLHIIIRDKKTGQRTVAEWWDDDARQMFEDGFFKRGVELKRSVIAYAEEMGLISKIGRNPRSSVRKNIFTFNNPGAAQRIVAENFVKGANSGVASSLYIHGNRIYSYGPHFPIAERQEGMVVITARRSPSKTTSAQIGLVKAAAKAAGLEVMYQELAPEAKGPAAYSNPQAGSNGYYIMGRHASVGWYLTRPEAERVAKQMNYRGGTHYTVVPAGPVGVVGRTRSVRKNIFTFNNPRGGENEMEKAARAVGLFVTTWAPGDGVTRYRFFTKPGAGSTRYADYNQGDGLYTALGRKDALAFIRAYGMGKGGVQANPPSGSVRTYKVPGGLEGRVASFLRNAFIWAQARDGEVLTLATPEVAKRAILHIKKGGGGWTRENPSARKNCCNPPRGGACRCAKRNPLTVSESRDIADEARREALTGGQTKSPGSRGYHLGRSSGMVDVVKKYGPDFVRQNPLLQTVLLANPGSSINNRERELWISNDEGLYRWWKSSRLPLRQFIQENRDEIDAAIRSVLDKPPQRSRYNPPISSQWDRMTLAQREHALQFSGIPRDFSGGLIQHPWRTLSAYAKRALESSWSHRASGQTTVRRAVPVGVNPLTRKESAQILREARNDVRYAGHFKAGHTRSEKSGQGYAKARVVNQFGPRGARKVSSRVMHRAMNTVGTEMSGSTFAKARVNPGRSITIPFREGEKVPIERARAWVAKYGTPELKEAFRKGERLQAEANRHPKFVIWRTLPIGDPSKLEMVTAMTHYGDTPDTYYKPPKGSKKGQHLYRHKWGETGGEKSVPLLAAPGGKALIMPLDGRKVADEWLRH